MSIRPITIATLATLALLSAALFFLRSEPAASAPAPVGTPVPMNLPTQPPGGPTWTPTPTSQPPSFTTNTTDVTANFMNIKGLWLSGATPPAECGTPIYFDLLSESGTNEFGNYNTVIEALWQTPCIDPGDKVFLSFGTNGRFRGATFALDQAVGGVAELPDAAPAAPLDIEESSSANVGLWAAIAAAAAVGALGGATWYARRRARG